MIGNLNNYVIFHTVAKSGNISRAANQLYISQPAISKSISKLEAELGTALFSRGSRGVTLTEEGQVLYEYVERAFDNLSQGEENLKKYSELGIGHVRIGVSTSLCKHILLGYLKDFIRDNPNIRFSIDCHSTLNTIKLLKNDAIDIGLICSTELPKGIVYSPVKEIHDVFVASRDYLDNFYDRANDIEQIDLAANLAGSIKGNIIPLLTSQGLSDTEGGSSDTKNRDTVYPSGISTIDILENSNLMVLEEANVTRTHVDEYLRSQGISCSQVLEINNMDLLIDFAAIGMGVSSVVREFAQEQLNSGIITELPLDTPIPSRSVGFAYPEAKKQSKAVRKFLEWVGV
ncbi:MAG: LysR family transcriptional regulator [Coprococcus sp.]|nr:LysR family transcriptional regulator [Coprococcus sp.]